MMSYKVLEVCRHEWLMINYMSFFRWQAIQHEDIV